MPRPVSPPRLYYDADRQTWAILHRGCRTRLGLARGEASAAQIRLVEYVLALGRAAPALDRPARRIMLDELLERYLARRTDADPAVRVKKVRRPR